MIEARHLLRDGEPFVYAYYEGIDKVAHEYGLGDHYEAELAYVDRLIGDLASGLPAGAAMVVTADHGQVEVGDNVVDLASRRAGPGLLPVGRGALPLAARPPGRTDALLEAAVARHGADAWVVSRDQVDRRGLVRPDGHRRGPLPARRRGAGRPRSVAFFDPDDSGPFELVSRHGSLTSAEMRVPLLAPRA